MAEKKREPISRKAAEKIVGGEDFTASGCCGFYPCQWTAMGQTCSCDCKNHCSCSGHSHVL